MCVCVRVHTCVRECVRVRNLAFWYHVRQSWCYRCNWKTYRCCFAFILKKERSHCSSSWGQEVCHKKETNQETISVEFMHVFNFRMDFTENIVTWEKQMAPAKTCCNRRWTLTHPDKSTFLFYLGWVFFLISMVVLLTASTEESHLFTLKYMC